MLTVGIDIGSSATKAVLIKNGMIAETNLILTSFDSTQTGQMAFHGLLKKAALQADEISYIVATGYGRINVEFADKVITEISCHAKGLNHIFPNVRTILDMGGQDCKVIRLSTHGTVEQFVMNDRCAAGTGRYLERIAKALHLSIENIGGLSQTIVKAPASVSSFCTVFAEGDAILMLRKGEAVSDILAGVCEGITDRVIKLIHRLGLEEDFAVTGGIAQNCGIISRLEKKLGVKVFLPEQPQLIGALGAALFARELACRKGNEGIKEVQDEKR